MQPQMVQTLAEHVDQSVAFDNSILIVSLSLCVAQRTNLLLPSPVSPHRFHLRSLPESVPANYRLASDFCSMRYSNLLSTADSYRLLIILSEVYSSSSHKKVHVYEDEYPPPSVNF